VLGVLSRDTLQTVIADGDVPVGILCIARPSNAAVRVLAAEVSGSADLVGAGSQRY
jgi:hypothetical protein